MSGVDEALASDLRRLSEVCGVDVDTAERAALEVLRARRARSGQQPEQDASFVEWLQGPRGPVPDVDEPLAGDADTILDQFAGLLRQLADRPDVPVGSHSLVTPSSALRLPDPAAPLTASRFERAADTFFACASRLSGEPAVHHAGAVCTYAELADRVRAIASRLRAAGLGPTDVVAVTGPRTESLVAAMLAVLAAPCVLLTIDPALPAARRRTMVEHVVPRAVLVAGGDAEDDWLRGLPVHSNRVDADRYIAGGASAHAATLAASGGDAAYIFFTSGSTGTPKAVLGSHNGLAHFLAWQRDTFAVGPGDRSAQLTGLSFDVVLRDVLTPLTSGASLHLPAETEEAGSGGTLAWLERDAITLLHTVPSLAAAWLAQRDPEVTLRALRWVFFAGEPLTSSLLTRWRAAFPSSGQIANLYGPTETTLATCCFIVPDPPLPGVQPIGVPLPGAQALVLGAGDQLCGIGEPGEIVIRTPYRSHGYLQNPREQQARFGPNPAGDDPDDLVYRTGDRGRYRADGSLDILGRIDDEVKIRGVRVAPAEVSAAIARHPAVREAVVIGDHDADGDAFLAAYVVPLASLAPDAAFGATLRSDLAQALPPAFVPSHVTVLDRLPLTANGKVDRTALPRPIPAARPSTEGRAPTETERAIAEEWQRVLGISGAGIDEDFFALGGHSLLAAQLLARFRARFDVRLPLRAIFERPTIRKLAALIEEQRTHA